MNRELTPVYFAPQGPACLPDLGSAVGKLGSVEEFTGQTALRMLSLSDRRRQHLVRELNKTGIFLAGVTELKPFIHEKFFSLSPQLQTVNVNH